MGIQYFTLDVPVALVNCQHCSASIVVRKWRDAGIHGWAVPSDGGMQLCPTCAAAHKAKLLAKAVQPDKRSIPSKLQAIKEQAVAEGDFPLAWKLRMFIEQNCPTGKENDDASTRTDSLLG